MIFRFGLGLADRLAVLLQSDPHVESARCDRKRIVAELERARAESARVLVNGDVMDLILPGDRKRYHPGAVCREVVGSDSPINATLDLAESIYGPYADLIDGIGMGNHEAAAVKFHSVDLTSMLVDRLNRRRKSGGIRHLGYSGAVCYTFRGPKGGGASYWIRYHHGAGGDAPQTEGKLDFARWAKWTEGAHVLWLGHKHRRHVTASRTEYLPRAGDEIRTRVMWHVMTGTYSTGSRQFDDDGRYVSSYGREKMFGPEHQGGAMLYVQCRGRDREFETRVELTG